MSRRTKKPRPNAVLAALLAWLVPGAGHVYLGRTRRGVVLFVTIAVTFWAGVAVGGVMTVDRVSERWWFLADLCSGVHGLVAWRRAERVHDSVTIDPGERAARPVRADPELYQQVLIDAALAERKLALVAPQDTVARAYAGVAGLLNLLCIFDAALLAMMGVTGEPPGDPRPTREPSP